MLQHKWTIRQGNVACLSVWPGQWTSCGQATHSVFLPSSWAVCEMCFLVALPLCVFVYVCVSLCVVYSWVVTQRDESWQLQLFW